LRKSGILDVMRRLKSVTGLVFSIGLFMAVLIAVWQREAIYDWLRLYNYQPPAAVMQLASATTMNDNARRIFYVQHPEIADKAAFNKHCGNDEQTIVLGCYINRQGIYIFGVNDPRLDGVEEVTAVHEMLHAAYDRLGKSERERINSLIDQAYANLTDQRIRDTFEAYRTAGADTANELHSILGTEVPSLPTQLETYYKRYFTNRAAIVGYSEQYQKAFSDRKAQATSLLAQLKQLKTQLDRLGNQIDQTEQQLDNEAKIIASEHTTTQDIPTFNARVNAYNAKITRLKGQIASHNQLVGQYNDVLSSYQAITFEAGQLIKAIDSRSSSTVQAE